MGGRLCSASEPAAEANGHLYYSRELARQKERTGVDMLGRAAGRGADLTKVKVI